MKNPNDRFQRPSSDELTAVNKLVQHCCGGARALSEKSGAVNARLIVDDDGKTRNRLMRGSTKERYLVGKKVAVKSAFGSEQRPRLS